LILDLATGRFIEVKVPVLIAGLCGTGKSHIAQALGNCFTWLGYYERRASIITRNLDFPEWIDAFPNSLLGAATLDRLRHGAYRAILDGESFRAPKPLPQKPKNALVKGGEKP
jgi:DNA replication protein DnaC